MHSNETLASAFQSLILLMAKRAAATRAEGRDIIDLTLGEPGFNAPEHAERNAIYRQIRDAAHHVLRARDKLKISCHEEGAFYLLPQLKVSIDDQSLALDLLEAGVATVPGSAFGLPGHLRLSFATDEATLVEGCKRLVPAFEAYT